MIVAEIALMTAIVSTLFSLDQLPPEDTIPVQQLDKMVVTATRTARHPSELPVSITIISKEEIRNSAAKSVEDLLQYKTGIQIKRPIGMGEGVPMDIMIRGIPGSVAATRTLILVDGIPTNASGTPFLILNEIPLEIIRKIEIVRGPYSSLYGANAFGGVINIITQTGDGFPSFELTSETSFPFTSLSNYFDDKRPYGIAFWRSNFDQSYWNGVVTSGGGNEKFDYLFSGGIRSIGNYFLHDSALVRNGDSTYLKSIDNHDYRDYRLFFKGGYQITDNLSSQLHIRFFNSDLGFGYIGEPKTSLQRGVRGEKFVIGPSLNYSASETFDLSFGGFYRKLGGEYLDKVQIGTVAIPSVWRAASDDYQLEGQGSIVAGRSHFLTVGFDYLWNVINFGAMMNRETTEKIAGYQTQNRIIRNAGIFLQDEIAIQSALKLVPAVRYDHHSEFGGAFSPKLGVWGRLSEHLTLRGSAGGAFRAPSTTELYLNLPIGSITVLGNPGLQPEYIWSFDGGFEIFSIADLSLKSDLFFNSMNNLISLRLPGDTIPVELYVTHANVDKAWSAGIESELSWGPADWLTATCNYSFTRSENREYSVPLDFIPNHKLNFDITLEKSFGKRRFIASIQEGFVGKRGYLDWQTAGLSFRNFHGYINPDYRILEPYWVTDVSLGYISDRNFKIVLTIQNLLNADYESSPGTFAPGRLAVVKVETGIKKR